MLGLGGLGHMGVKFLKALGARVTVLSHSPGKQQDAARLGADDFVVTSADDAFEKNAGRFGFILDTVSATHDYNALPAPAATRRHHGAGWPAPTRRCSSRARSSTSGAVSRAR